MKDRYAQYNIKKRDGYRLSFFFLIDVLDIPSALDILEEVGILDILLFYRGLVDVETREYRRCLPRAER